ncbi:MAG: endonuclease I family protein [Kiritimatiellia bacterium]
MAKIVGKSWAGLLILWLSSAAGWAGDLRLIQVLDPGEAWIVPAEKVWVAEEFVRVGESREDLEFQVWVPTRGEPVKLSLRARGVDRDNSPDFEIQFRSGVRFENPSPNPDRIALIGKLRDPEDSDLEPDEMVSSSARIRLADNARALYYKPAEGLKGQELKDALHRIICGHRISPYSSLWEKLAYTDEDPENPGQVVLFYTGWRVAKNRHGGNPSDWNREHVWPKSQGGFDNESPMGTDLHHLRPTDVSVNARRGNLSFDEGGEWVIDGDGATTNRVDGNSWEPRDEVKGDVARILFYMAVRYEGTADREPDLELTDKVNNLRNPALGRKSVLIRWHAEDPVDDFERRRNERIFEIQGNRNPFIDHPEWVECIWVRN